MFYHANENHVHAMPEDADGYAIPSCDLLSDFFSEHGDDPNEGDPETWPSGWWDAIAVRAGRPMCREEFVDVPGDGLDDDNPF